MKLSRLGPLLLLLMMLSACSARPLVKTEIVVLIPPSALLMDCPETLIPTSGNNGDLLEVARMLRLDLAECNRSKARLREWAASNSGTAGE